MMENETIYSLLDKKHNIDHIKLYQTDTSPLMEQQQKCSNWHLPADGTAAEMQ